MRVHEILEAQNPAYYQVKDMRGQTGEPGQVRTTRFTTGDFQWTDPGDVVQGYRANEKTKQGVESLPTQYYSPWIRSMLNAYKIGVGLNLIKPMTPEELTALLNSEGRSDFGFNRVDLRGKYQKIYDKMIAKGVQDTDASFVAGIADKQDTAARVGIPFYQAWNGGKQNLPRYQMNMAAATDPKNAALLQLVKKSMGYVQPAPVVEPATASAETPPNEL